MDEEWKLINGTTYEVSNKGRVKNNKGYIFNCNPRNSDGYIRVGINKKSKLVHRLVAKEFIPNDDPKLNCVNHKNGVRSDNNVSNLEWVTRQENNRKQVNSNYGKRTRKVVQFSSNNDYIKTWDTLKKAANHFGREKSGPISVAIKRNIKFRGFRWKYLDDYKKDEDDIIWKKCTYPGFTDIEVSNKGLIKTVTSHVTKGGKNGNYLNYRDKRIHVLIFSTFYPDKYDKNLQINHIDGNHKNNNIENLETCTGSENMRHAYRIGLCKMKKNNGRPILQLSLEGEVIREFSSIEEAKNITGISKGNISTICKNKGRRYKAGGYKWAYKE